VGVDALAAAPCIRIAAHCYASLPEALAAAQDGDTVRVPPGTFPGGVRITKSITLLGAGAERTVLAGGGPVLTIGTAGAATQPTVTIGSLTLTGGVVTSSEADDHRTDIAAGGGLEILPAAGGRIGATVTVVDSVIRDNRAEPATQLTQRSGPDVPICPSGPCPFAGAFGAGIDDQGDLTLQRTVVSGNTAAGVLTSDADGAGINIGRFFGGAPGVLTLDSSTVSGNRALAGDEWGRFAEGGGIFSGDGTTLTLEHSSVSGNEARLETDFPSYLADGTFLNMSANGGGLHVGNGVAVTVDASHIDGNRATIVGRHAQDGVGSAGMLVNQSPLVMRNSTVSHNTSTAEVQAAPMGDGGAFEFDGVVQITGSEFVGNTTTLVARAGDSVALAPVTALAIVVTGADPGPSVVSHSLIADNLTTVVAPEGSGEVLGGGLTNDAQTVLVDVRVEDNKSVGRSERATLRGGGIWNGAVLGFVPDPPSQLTLVRSRIEDNDLAGPPGAVLQGGGLFTEVPVVRQQTRIADNDPDQCVGC
jgi:hypothetical protein